MLSLPICQQGYLMPLTKSLPIDYAAIRVAIIRAIQWSTGLDQNHVIMAEPEVPNSPRPTLPYMTVKITSPSIRYGDDVPEPIDDPTGMSETLVSYGGPRKMVVSFNAYGTSHEQAYGLAALWQARLDQHPVRELLRRDGIAIWLIGEIRDLSLLLGTGFEGRAQMDVQCGLASNLSADLGAMEDFPFVGETDAGVIT